MECFVLLFCCCFLVSNFVDCYYAYSLLCRDKAMLKDLYYKPLVTQVTRPLYSHAFTATIIT